MSYTFRRTKTIKPTTKSSTIQTNVEYEEDDYTKYARYTFWISISMFFFFIGTFSYGLFKGFPVKVQ